MIERYLLEEKISGYLLKLNAINEALNEEMQKHYAQRDQLLLNFLSKERSVYKFALSELQSLLAVKPPTPEAHESKQGV